MPKAPNSRPSNVGGSSKPKHYTPLHQELNADEKLAKYGKVKNAEDGKKGRGRAKARGPKGDDGLEKVAVPGEQEEGTHTTSSRMSRKILDLARDQQAEIDAERSGSRGKLASALDSDGEWEDDEDDEEDAQGGRRGGDEDEDEEEGYMGEDGEEEEEVEEYDLEDLEIDPEDYTTLDAIARGQMPTASSSAGPKPSGGFAADLDDALPLGAEALPSDDGEPKTLADIIFAKMNEQEELEKAKAAGLVPKAAGQGAIPERRPDGTMDPRVGLNPKVVEVYTKVGLLLSRYKSGPLPRALKILPSLPHWAQLLSLTNPPTWTPHATFACTRIFVSNLKPDQVRVFLQGILLDRVRENMADLASSKSGKKGVRLDSQLYEALKKALYKPAAFFKGVLFPLCEQGCSLREATIVASVLSKVSVPVLHSAAAILRLAGMDYTGPNSLFIRVLLDKKYALPYKVVDALVFHFIRLANSPRSRDGEDKLPVLWHQSLLVFVQRYGSDLTPDQKDALLDVIRARPHPQISQEIRREILSSVVRGEPRPEEVEGDVMMG